MSERNRNDNGIPIPPETSLDKLNREIAEAGKERR